MSEDYKEVLEQIELKIAELQELIEPFDKEAGERNPIAEALEHVQVEIGWEYASREG